METPPCFLVNRLRAVLKRRRLPSDLPVNTRAGERAMHPAVLSSGNRLRYKESPEYPASLPKNNPTRLKFHGSVRTRLDRRGDDGTLYRAVEDGREGWRVSVRL